MTHDSRRTESLDTVYGAIDSMAPNISLATQLNAHIEALQKIRPVINDMTVAIKVAVLTLSGTTHGRLIYAGAGTSARLGTQDGTELPPTFRWPHERLAFVVAGGLSAIFKAAEGAEDSREQAIAEIEKLNVSSADVVIGLAASGTTPFTVAAIDTAKKFGAVTIGITNNEGSALAQTAEFGLTVATGPEVIAGSTRLAAGTTQKVMLNMISNQIMIGLNKVFNGQMVDMNASNIKLRGRAEKMVMHLTGCSEVTAKESLDKTGYWVKPALLVAQGVTPDQAQKLLAENHGNLKTTLEHLSIK